VRLRLSLIAIAALAAGAPAGALAASAPDDGRPFDPAPVSPAVYGIKPPSADPARQRHIVEAKDGVDLYVETWLPAPKDGSVVPERLPTVLIMTPYVKQGVMRSAAENAINYLTARGYAVAQHHVRGTGESGGCLEQTSTNQIDDAARVIEYLGKDAPWASGSVGMYGKSYDAETQISVAGLGNPAMTQYLKAIVPIASVGGQYEYSFFDGVPYTGQAILSNSTYFALTSATPGETSTPAQFVEKTTCQPELFAGSADQSGDMTPFWKVREYRPGAKNIRAAMLYVHGLVDWNVKPLTAAGFFDRLPPTTPKAGVFGIWAHEYPDVHPATHPEWERSDWLPMAGAWFDRYLKGLDSGVDAWPVVQVQDTEGQWRAEPEWPTMGGPVGQLALNTGGKLGATAPTGSTSYREGPEGTDGSSVTFETPPLADRLQITGQPVLDLWAMLDLPDAHISARIEAIDAKGTKIPFAEDFGYRSARHLDPMPNNHFVQEQGKQPPTLTPLHIPVRFHPTNFVVPKGGKLRVTVAGSIDGSEPSGFPTGVGLMHDCTTPTMVSTLRFLMPRSRPDRLNVREKDEKGALGAATPRDLVASDGGGIATAPVCGKPAARLDTFGPERPAGETVESPAACAGAGACAPPVGTTPYRVDQGTGGGRPRPASPGRVTRLRLFFARPGGPARRRGRARTVIALPVRAHRGEVVRNVLATLKKLDKKGRPGAVVGSSGRAITVRGKKTLTIRVRRGLKPGRYLLVLTGRDARGRPGRASARLRFT
jgi:predicted acyl esterase